MVCSGYIPLLPALQTQESQFTMLKMYGFVCQANTFLHHTLSNTCRLHYIVRRWRSSFTLCRLIYNRLYIVFFSKWNLTIRCKILRYALKYLTRIIYSDYKCGKHLGFPFSRKKQIVLETNKTFC